jgi:hypothetical protein
MILEQIMQKSPGAFGHRTQGRLRFALNGDLTQIAKCYEARQWRVFHGGWHAGKSHS